MGIKNKFKQIATVTTSMLFPISMLFSACDGKKNTPVENDDFTPGDTMRVVSVSFYNGGRTFILANRTGKLFYGSATLNDNKILQPERGDTLIVTNADPRGTIVKIKKNLTAERLIQEFATQKQK